MTTKPTESLAEVQRRTDLDRATAQKVQLRHGTGRIPFAVSDGLFWYTPIPPQPDTDDLAKSARLMLYHDRGDGPRLFVAPAGDLQAGWVVGVGG
jgi:hypothetical protein